MTKDTNHPASAPAPKDAQSQALAAHLRCLLLHPASTAATAQSLAQQISKAIEHTKGKLSDSQGLEIFEDIAKAYQGFSDTLKQKDAALCTLKDEILGLKKQSVQSSATLAALQKQLKAANDKLAKLQDALNDEKNPKMAKSLATAFDTLINNFSDEFGTEAGRTIGAMAPMAALYVMLGGSATALVSIASAAAKFLGK